MSIYMGVLIYPHVIFTNKLLKFWKEARGVSGYRGAQEYLQSIHVCFMKEGLFLLIWLAQGNPGEIMTTSLRGVDWPV